MSVNNEMYKMYNEMVKGYKENQDGLFEHGARCWMDLKPENPFAPEDPAYEYFFLMQKGYNLWTMGLADRKINRRRMLENARKLCELNPKRPYKFDKKAEELELAAKAAAEKKAAEERALAEKKAAEEKALAEKKMAEEKALAEKKAAQEKAEAQKLEARKKTETTQYQSQNTHILGIVPDVSDIKADTAKEQPVEKKGFFNRLFRK